MTLVEIAEIYTGLVKLEKEIPVESYQAKDHANSMRTKYHELLMAKMREVGISFSDRFDATRKAFEIVQKEQTLT